MIDNGEYTGWFVALFFSICTVVFIVIFLPNSSYLRITNQGFEIRSLYRSNFTNWNEVKEFGYGYVGGKKMVVFNYSPSHSKFQTTKNVAKTLTSIEGALPDIYGKSPEELAQLLNELKEKYSNLGYNS